MYEYKGFPLYLISHEAEKNGELYISLSVVRDMFNVCVEGVYTTPSWQYNMSNITWVTIADKIETGV